MPSALLVGLQFAALVAVVLPAGAPQWHPVGYLPLAAACVLGGWTLAHNRPGNFSVFPEPRATARLVTTGPYAWVRHPMYLAVLLFAAGFVAGWRGLPHVAAFALLAVVLHVKAGREERLLRQRFPDYGDYAARTARIIPGLR
jgi:protein-S-isoprenylcysteine O-methyltransferase Ste14